MCICVFWWWWLVRIVTEEKKVAERETTEGQHRQIMEGMGEQGGDSS